MLSVSHGRSQRGGAAARALTLALAIEALREQTSLIVGEHDKKF